MIKEALNRGKSHKLTRRQLKNMPIQDMEFKDEEFNGIWCYDFINLVRKDEILKTAKEFYRILKKNGIIMITAFPEKMEKPEELEQFETEYYSQTELEQYLEEAGFKILNSISEARIEIFAKK